MRITLLKFTIALFLYSSSLLAQGNSAKQYLSNELTESDIQDSILQDSLVLWQEQVVLHTDKSWVVKDEPLFFKAYILTGPNRLRVNASNVLIVDLVDSSGEAILTQYHSIKSGTTSGSLDIPKKLVDGNYFIRAYTRWMKNYGDSFYYSKRLVISDGGKGVSESSLPVSEVTFHPEGGHLINSLTNRVVIKAIAENGTPANLQGTIVNKSGSISMPISKYDSGLFSATFTPRAKEVYQLKTSDGRTYNLPKVLDEGYQLSVNNLDSSKIIIIIKQTKTSKNNMLHLKGEMGGITYFKKNLTVDEGEVKLDILKKDIPQGIMKISLFDENREWASRFINIEGGNRLGLEIFSLENNDAENEIALKVIIRDDLGNPVKTELSLSATGKKGDNLQSKTQLQEEQFWATSSINTAREVIFLNDLRTQALNDKSFDLSRILANKRVRYPFQKGLELYGYAYDLNNNLLKNKEIQVIAGAKENVLVKEEKTDASGLLRLTNLQLIGENEMVFRTKGDDSKSRLVKFLQIENPTDDAQEINKKANVKRDGKKPLQPSVWQPIDTTGLIELDEVNVKDKRIKKKPTSSNYGVEPTRVAFQDVERPRTIPQMLLNVPGLQISGMGGLTPRVILPRSAGLGPILWVLDGFPLMQSTSLVDIISIVSSVDVERIEILLGPQASAYGSRAAAGVFLIYTRSGSDVNNITRKKGQLTYQGYHESTDFETFQKQYLKKHRNHKKNQTTVFWEPSLKTDENGEAIVRFKTPIDFDHIEVNAKTITEEGEIGSKKVIIKVNE